MADPFFNSATVVLGMHRSGTSALTGLLGLCGLAVPRTLIPPDEGNERGHWESEPVKRLNDELLAKLQLSWHSLARVDPETLKARRFQESRKLASSILQSEFDRGADIVLKEPRISRLLPFWMPLLKRLSKRTGYAAIVRHPLEVAQSLSRRNDLDPQHAMLLWARYWLDAEFYTRGKPRAFASYESLLQNWQPTMGSLCEALELPIDLQAVNKRKIEAYLDADLRHEVANDDERLGRDVPIIAEIYRILSGWCGDAGESSSDYGALDESREQLDRLSRLVADVFESSRLYRKRLGSARSQAEKSARDLSLALRSLDHQSREAEALKHQASQIEEVRVDLSHRFAALEQQIHPLLGNLSEGMEESEARDRAIAAAITAMGTGHEKLLKSVQSEIHSALSDIRKIDEAGVRLERALGSVTELQRAAQASHADGLAKLNNRIEDRRLVEQALADATRVAADELPKVKSSIEDRKLVEQALADATRATADELPSMKASIAEAARAATDSAGKIETALGAVIEIERDIQTTFESELVELKASLGDRLRVEQAFADAARVAADANERVERALARLAEVESELQALGDREQAVAAELYTVKRKYRAAQSDVAREQRNHEKTKSALAATEATFARYRASLLWTIYMALAGWGSRLRKASPRLVGGRRRRRRAQLHQITESGLFDAKWYLTTYPDVAEAKIDPLTHFCETGWREGRDPGPDFATSAYLKANSDVARMGVNPLLHYTEFGRFEGREVRIPQPSSSEGTAPSSPKPATNAVLVIDHDFPEAAPVFRGEITDLTPVRWVRSYRLKRDDPRLLSLQNCVIGYAEDGTVRNQAESEFSRLARLSGLQSADPLDGIALDYSSAELSDAWFVNETQLRVRWTDERSPFVVRAFQHDPLNEGRLSLVGEGLIESDLDFIDVVMKNPYFPVIFTFSDSSGLLRGARLLPFPSLCRGGLHYPEVVWSSPADPDPLGVGLAAAQRLESLEKGADRLVHSIAVDLSGADGTGPLFQAPFCKWLNQVMGVTLTAGDDSNEILGELLCLHGRTAEERVNTLVLAADMIPAIHVLTEAQGEEKGPRTPVFVPLLIAEQDPSQPISCVRLPDEAPTTLQINVPGYPAAWPQLNLQDGASLPDSIGPAAIRVRNHDTLSDPELAMPVSGALALPEMDPTEITWVIILADWRPSELVQSLRALSLQRGAGTQTIGFVGQSDSEALKIAKSIFQQRVRVFADLADAASKIDTPMLGYLGRGVILHDEKSVALLAYLIGANSALLSAACPMVKAEKRGKGWHFSVVDGGAFHSPLSLETSAQSETPDIRLWWRSCFPVLAPPRDLWLARTETAKDWLRNGSSPKPATGMHIFTTLITASYLGDRPDPTGNVPAPAPAEGVSTKVRVLFG